MQDSKIVNFNGKTYTANFPNVGQELQIESLKQALSAGKYDDMIQSRLKTTLRALDTIDTISYFTVMLPEITKELSTKDFSTIKQQEMKPIVELFQKEIYPWLKEGYDELSSEDDVTIPATGEQDK